MANIFRTASMWLKIAIVCMFIGLVIFIIGFATPYWKGNWGLFNFYNGRTTEIGSHVNDFHKAIQAMECIGLIGFVLALVTLLLYLCADTMRRRDFLQAATVFTFVGVLFACIGFAMFGSSNEKNYGTGRDLQWSFGLAIAGTAFYIVAGVMLILQLIGR